MNPHLIQLFESKSRLNRLVERLPRAFEIVKNEVPSGNPAVGILREHVLSAFFIDEFGQEHVRIPDDGVRRGYDLKLHDHKLSIKTTTGSSGVKVLWTVDPLQVGREIARDYEPDCDMFLVNIFWNQSKKSIFYIPLEVQQRVHQELGDDYLSAKVGTNHRGISITSTAMRCLKSHEQTLSANVNWQRRGLDNSPYKRWLSYWNGSQGRLF